MRSRSKTTCFRNTRNDFILTDCVTRGALLFLNFKLGLYLYKTVSSSVASSRSIIDLQVHRRVSVDDLSSRHLIYHIAGSESLSVDWSSRTAIIEEKADKEPRATDSLAIQHCSLLSRQCVHDCVRMYARTHARTQCRVARTCVHAVQVPLSYRLAHLAVNCRSITVYSVSFSA